MCTNWQDFKCHVSPLSTRWACCFCCREFWAELRIQIVYNTNYFVKRLYPTGIKITENQILQIQNSSPCHLSAVLSVKIISCCSLTLFLAMWHSYHSCPKSSCDCERWNVHSLKCADKECSCDKSHLTLSELTSFPLNWMAVNWVICHGCNQSEQAYWMTTCHDPVTRIIIGVTVVSFYSSVTLGLPAVFWLVAAVRRDPVHCSHDQPLSTQFRSKWGELRWDLIWTLTSLCGCNIFLSRFIVIVLRCSRRH